MLLSDARATAVIAFADALDDDLRIKQEDRGFLSYYKVKLASQITRGDEDSRFVFIIRTILPIWMSNV